jgi:hypothetical protein
MTLDELDRELDRLQQASERVAANLVELEIDSSRQLLEASTLTGESAARWSAASAALTELWEWRGLLERFLERAQELRGSSRLAAELRALLTGPAIELARSQVPLAERDLLGSSEVTVGCTADELLERMAGAFDEVKTVVAEIGTAWEALTPRLTVARKLVEWAHGLAASLGESRRSDLADAAHRLAALTAALSADPLSVAPGHVDALIDSLEAIQRELEAAIALRGAFEARLADARALVGKLRAVAEEGQTAHGELLVKIAVPSAPAAPGPPADLEVQLDEIGARNQLRALLEAYQVKAGRLGAVENPELERVFAQAHQALYTAPTDLAIVAQLVRPYQELVSAAPPAHEAIR